MRVVAARVVAVPIFTGIEKHAHNVGVAVLSRQCKRSMPLLGVGGWQQPFRESKRPGPAAAGRVSARECELRVRVVQRCAPDLFFRELPGQPGIVSSRKRGCLRQNRRTASTSLA